ncbi:hypothetical protein BQ8482_130211 [Mesorhizobium delmotii]|uniref:Mutator family transposase n=1 Tax=Mesorhizobium delmotii TaxID=1631247 RepID=A0A2P9AGQ1_9HYPH|nr:hypothetical protein BQ8482_130211 [Mesorhizobium delmotii]
MRSRPTATSCATCWPLRPIASWRWRWKRARARRRARWDTRAGRIALEIPKLRKGSYFPSFLEPRRTAEKALVAVIQEAYVHGIAMSPVSAMRRAIGETWLPSLTSPTKPHQIRCILRASSLRSPSVSTSAHLARNASNSSFFARRTMPFRHSQLKKSDPPKEC